MTREELNIRILEIKEIQKEKTEKYYSIIRTILTISVGLLGILISLKSETPLPLYKSILYSLAISSIGLGILFSLIVLFSEVNVLNQIRKKSYDNIINILDGFPRKDVEFESVKPIWIYRISSRLNIFFYLISLVCLTLYSSYDLIKHFLTQ